MSTVRTQSTSVTYACPNDPAEHPDYDAAFEAELNAHYDAIASDVSADELEAMRRQQEARAIEEWFNAPNDVHFAA